jgi:hypothetical protein
MSNDQTQNQPLENKVYFLCRAFYIGGQLIPVSSRPAVVHLCVDLNEWFSTYLQLSYQIAPTFHEPNGQLQSARAGMLPCLPLRITRTACQLWSVNGYDVVPVLGMANGCGSVEVEDEADAEAAADAGTSVVVVGRTNVTGMGITLELQHHHLSLASTATNIQRFEPRQLYHVYQEQPYPQMVEQSQQTHEEMAGGQHLS